MSNKVFIFFSLIIHSIAYMLWSYQPQSQKLLALKKGEASSIPVAVYIPKPNKIKQQKSPQKSSEQPEQPSAPQANKNYGNPHKEIQKFKHSLQYPLQAKEQELESECSWQIEIDANGRASHIRTIQPCLYDIFEHEFRTNVSKWKFNLAEGTVLKIPVSFIIER